eukprot:3138050-Prymnesium_polylepis.3
MPATHSSVSSALEPPKWSVSVRSVAHPTVISASMPPGNSLCGGAITTTSKRQRMSRTAADGSPASHRPASPTASRLLARSAKQPVTRVPPRRVPWSLSEEPCTFLTMRSCARSSGRASTAAPAARSASTASVWPASAARNRGVCWQRSVGSTLENSPPTTVRVASARCRSRRLPERAASWSRVPPSRFGNRVMSGAWRLRCSCSSCPPCRDFASHTSRMSSSRRTNIASSSRASTKKSMTCSSTTLPSTVNCISERGLSASCASSRRSGRALQRAARGLGRHTSDGGLRVQLLDERLKCVRRDGESVKGLANALEHARRRLKLLNRLVNKAEGTAARLEWCSRLGHFEQFVIEEKRREGRAA